MIPSLQPYLYGAMAIAALGVVTGAYLKGGADRERKITLKQFEAEREAERFSQVVRRGQETLRLASSNKFSLIEVRLVREVETRVREVTKHVTETRGCITYGFVRVLDAAVQGVPADSLRLPAGESDHSCAPVTNAAVAEGIIRNYGSAALNAAQLDGLNAFVREQVALTP